MWLGSGDIVLISWLGCLLKVEGSCVDRNVDSDLGVRDFLFVLEDSFLIK